MPEVFINYRTGDGEKTAALIEKELSHRFGKEKIFWASKSIKPGTRYPEELLGNLRSSSVLLAVIGPEWTRFPALYDENDWVRREILEAIACGIPVVPVLDGRGTERLSGRDLPPELKRLADYQSVRLDLREAESGLAKIAKELTDLVPTLRDRTDAQPQGQGAVHNEMGDAPGPSIQGRDIIGDHGRFHLGPGNQYNQHFSGPGATYVEGGNSGEIRHRFGGSGEGEEEDR